MCLYNNIYSSINLKDISDFSFHCFPENMNRIFSTQRLKMAIMIPKTRIAKERKVARKLSSLMGGWQS